LLRFLLDEERKKWQVLVQFFKWEVGEKNHTTKENVPLIPHNFGTTQPTITICATTFLSTTPWQTARNEQQKLDSLKPSRRK